MLALLTLYVTAGVGFFLMLLHDRDIRLSTPIMVGYAILWPLFVALMAAGFVFHAVRR